MKGFDTSTVQSLTNYTNAKNAGYSFVCRYYSNPGNLKNLTKAEAIDATTAGLTIAVVYETNPTHASYFTYSQGQSDCAAAVSMALSIGQYTGSVIYFAVDYDAQPVDFPAIKQYFNGIVDYMTAYANLHGSSWGIGIYGSYNVSNYIIQNVPNVGNVWQTGVWNPTNQFVDYSILQKTYNQTIPGVNGSVDIDYSNPDGHSLGDFTVYA